MTSHISQICKVISVYVDMVKGFLLKWTSYLTHHSNMSVHL